MATDYSNLTVCVVDQGLYVHVATKLAETFGEVLYCLDSWRSAFPESPKANIGAGLMDNMRVVDNLWPHVNDVDLFVFPDIYYSGEQAVLRAMGKRVWGSGYADQLELYRDHLKTVLKSVGLPVGPYEVIDGLEALREYLRENPDVYVKGNVFRGDIETFHNTNWIVTEPLLNDLANRLGPRADFTRFIVEDPIEGVEIGYDGYCVDGEYPGVTSFGYEAKDAGYIGKAVDYDDLPAAIRMVNQKFAPILAGLGLRGFYSNEIRVGNDADHTYLLDPAVRCGSPPSESYVELFSNWDEVIYEGAGGQVIDLQPTAKFSAEIILKSEWARDHFLALDIPKDARQWIKIHGHCRMGGKDYAVPLGIREIGAAVGIGDTMEDAVKMALENAGAVSGLELEYNKSALDDCMDVIEKGEKVGIDFL